MKVFVVLSAVLAIACAAPSSVNDEPSSFRKMVANCLSSEDTVTCLSIKGITALNRVARSANFEIMPGVSFQRDQSVSARSAKAISENEIADSLPADSTERSGRLFDLAMDSLSNFIETHSLQIKFPKEASEQVARAIDEGRGKLKKVVGPLLLAVGAKLIAFVPLFLGGLIFLAIKALVVSKIAFLLAAVLGFQKFGGGGNGLGLLSKVTNGVGGWPSSTANNAWSSGSTLSSQYPYARNYENAHDLAYNAYAGEQSAAAQ